MRSGVAASLLQVLGIEPNDSTTKTTMMRKRNKRDAPAEMVPSRNNKNESNGEALQAKNHKLAKELSECRIKQREEAKNVSRLTMENMNLASRCREAIAQAAALKKELSLQKKKTAEAVHQTHQLISQVKRMSPERQPQSRNVMVTPDVTTEATPIMPMPQLDDSEHKEDDVQIVHRHEKVLIPEEKEVRTVEKKTSEESPDVSPIPSPPGNKEDVSTATPKPDAPTSSEDDLEESDTVAEIIPEKPIFPRAASPRMSRKSLNDSYDEEYPEEPPVDAVAKKKASSLLSSIDAFEASFSTSFPDSFTPKDEESIKTGLYNPFDTSSPAKSDPPANLSLTERTSSPKTLSGTSNPKEASTLSPKQVEAPLNLKAVSNTRTTSDALSPKNSKNGVKALGLEVSPRDTPPRKLTRLQEEKSSLLVETLPVSLNMVELQNESPESPDIEVISPNGKTRLTPVISPRTNKSSYEMVARGTDIPEVETFPSRMRSRRVGPNPEPKPSARFKKSLTVDTTTAARQSAIRGTPLSSRSNGDSPSEGTNRFQRATRTFNHVGTAAAKVRELKARDRSASAPRIRSTSASLTFSENHERPQKLAGYGTARARYERAIQSPKDVSDIPLDGRQRRNVNLSNRRRADFGNGASPLVSSPKSLATK